MTIGELRIQSTREFWIQWQTPHADNPIGGQVPKEELSEDGEVSGNAAEEDTVQEVNTEGGVEAKKVEVGIEEGCNVDILIADAPSSETMLRLLIKEL